MVANAKEEAAEKHRVAADRAEALGRQPPRPPVWKRLGICAVSKFPFAVLQYITECRTWLDGAMGVIQGHTQPCVQARPLRSGWDRV